MLVSISGSLATCFISKLSPVGTLHSYVPRDLLTIGLKGAAVKGMVVNVSEYDHPEFG